MSKYTNNEALKLFKSLKTANASRRAYANLHKAKTSEVFKHELQDKRVKDKTRYGFIVNPHLVELSNALAFFESIDSQF
ncbi:MAG: hypothetical protein ACXWTU_00450 [Methylotenera sp.]